MYTACCEKDQVGLFYLPPLVQEIVEYWRKQLHTASMFHSVQHGGVVLQYCT